LRTVENNLEKENGVGILYDLYKTHEGGFRRFCTVGNSAISVVTYKDYVNGMSTWGSKIRTPEDIVNFYTDNEIKLSEKFVKPLEN